MSAYLVLEAADCRAGQRPENTPQAPYNNPSDGVSWICRRFASDIPSSAGKLSEAGVGAAGGATGGLADVAGGVASGDAGGLTDVAGGVASGDAGGLTDVAGGVLPATPEVWPMSLVVSLPATPEVWPMSLVVSLPAQPEEWPMSLVVSLPAMPGGRDLRSDGLPMHFESPIGQATDQQHEDRYDNELCRSAHSIKSFCRRFVISRRLYSAGC